MAERAAMRTRRATMQGTPGEGARLRGLLILLSPFVALTFAAGYAVRAAWPWPAVPRAGAGLALIAAGLAAALWNWLYARRLRAYLKGARGEERVARELALLPAGYSVFNDVAFPGGASCDHVAIGPNGVFVIETKAWSAAVTVVDGDVQRCDGVMPSRSPLEQVKRAVAALKVHLRAAGVEAPEPAAVVCFAEGEVEGGVRGVAGVIVCSRTALNGLILGADDARLAPETQTAACAALEALVGTG